MSSPVLPSPAADLGASPISELTPEQLNTAHAALDGAVQQLIQPTVHHVPRSSPDEDPSVREVDTEHDALVAELHAQHARHVRQLRAQHAADVRRHDGPRQTRHMGQILKAEDALRTRLAQLEREAAARRATITRLPSMVEQLVDAVANTQGGGGAAAGPHRSPIGLAAAELVHRIERVTRPAPSRRGEYRRLDRPRPVKPRPKPTADALTASLRHWAAQAGHWRTQQPEQLLDAARTAERWAAAGWEILDPTRITPIPGMCPRCRRRTVHVVDDLGEQVERAVLNLARDEGTVRCTAPCPEAWGPDRLRWLGELLAEQDAEAAAEVGEAQDVYEEAG